MERADLDDIMATTRSDTDSPVPSLFARLYAQSSLAIRRQLVSGLLRVTGPLALAALADGRFSRFLLRSSADRIVVTLEDARRLTEAQVLALARYAWEASPGVFLRIVELLKVEDPTLLRTFTGALFLLALGMKSRTRGRIRRGRDIP